MPGRVEGQALVEARALDRRGKHAQLADRISPVSVPSAGVASRTLAFLVPVTGK